MLVRMIHEKHGEHICYAQWEVDQCLANGWKLKPDPLVHVGSPPEAKPIPNASGDVPIAPLKKRGRPKKNKP